MTIPYLIQEHSVRVSMRWGFVALVSGLLSGGLMERAGVESGSSTASGFR